MSHPSMSLPSMSLPSGIACAILGTVLDRVALLLLSGAAGDLTAARHGATRMLAAHYAETEEEIRLAGEVISFGLHALSALGQAADPGLPLTTILRFRASAVSLSRESHKFQRQLDRLQRARRAGIRARPAEAQFETPIPQPEASVCQPETSVPRVEISVPRSEAHVPRSEAFVPQSEAAAPEPEAAAGRPRLGVATGSIECVAGITESSGKNAGMTWTQSYHKRLTAKRLAAKAMKQQARQAARTAPSNPAAATAALPNVMMAAASIVAKPVAQPPLPT